MIEAPIFIVGVPRSGTTLLSSMLAAHPLVSISDETHFLNRVAKPRLEKPDLSEAEFTKFWAEYTRTLWFSSLGFDAAAIERRIRAAGSYHLAAIFAAILAEDAAAQRKARAGEKTPGHERYTGILLSWYPDARVVYVVRDPRAVIASVMRTPWGRFASLDQHARRWRESVQRFRQWQNDPRVCLVRYERLVADPEGSLKSLCNFLGLEFSPAMISARKAKQRSVPTMNWANQHLDQAAAPVTTASVDAWRSHLKPAQVTIIEHFCGPELTASGYDRCGGKAGPLDLVQAWAVRTAMRVRRRLQIITGRREAGVFDS